MKLILTVICVVLVLLIFVGLEQYNKLLSKKSSNLPNTNAKLKTYSFSMNKSRDKNIRGFKSNTGNKQ